MNFGDACRACSSRVFSWAIHFQGGLQAVFVRGRGHVKARAGLAREHLTAHSVLHILYFSPQIKHS